MTAFGAKSNEESIESGPSPDLEIQRVPSGTSPEKIAELLLRDGAVVVTGLLGLDTVAELNSDLDPYVSARSSGFGDGLQGDFFGATTVRVQGLAMKSDVFVSECLLDPTLLGVMDLVLLPNCGDYWLSLAGLIFLQPGDKAQVLHRDDINWAIPARLGIDLQVSAMIAIGDFDAEAGATMVIPRTHRLPIDQAVDPRLAQPVDLERGDAVLWLGSTLHQGGANQTSDRVRKGLYLSYMLGWLVPEEASALSLTPSRVEELPDRARQLLGMTSLKGNPADDATNPDMQLWQVDKFEVSRVGSNFTNRTNLLSD